VKILGIDPGTKQSAAVVLTTAGETWGPAARPLNVSRYRVLDADGIIPNAVLEDRLARLSSLQDDDPDIVVIEKPVLYGKKRSGTTLGETIWWAGIFYATAKRTVGAAYLTSWQAVANLAQAHARTALPAALTELALARAVVETGKNARAELDRLCDIVNEQDQESILPILHTLDAALAKWEGTK
jgi:hypothetical protein